MKILSNETAQQLEAALKAAFEDCVKSPNRRQAYTLKNEIEALQRTLKKFNLLPDIQQPAPKKEDIQEVQPEAVRSLEPDAEEVQPEEERSPVIVQAEVLTQTPPAPKRQAPKKPRIKK